MAMLGAKCSPCCSEVSWWGLALRDWTGDFIGWNFFGRAWKESFASDLWSYRQSSQFPDPLTESWETIWNESGNAIGSIPWVNANAPYHLSSILVEMKLEGANVLLRLTLRGVVTIGTPGVSTDPVVVTYSKPHANYESDISTTQKTEFLPEEITYFSTSVNGWAQGHCGSIAVIKNPEVPPLFGKTYSWSVNLGLEEIKYDTSFPIVIFYPHTLSDNAIEFAVNSESSCLRAVTIGQGCGYAAGFGLPQEINQNILGYAGSFLFSGWWGIKSQYANESEPSCLPVEDLVSGTIYQEIPTRIAIHWVAFVAFSEDGVIATENYAACPVALDFLGTSRNLAGINPTSFTFSQADRPARRLLELDFDACFGSGARGYAETSEDFGPITKTVMRNGGAGYAKLGRAAPTLTVSNESDEPADLTITLSQEQDECGVDYWTVASISVVDGGTGYTDGEAIAIAVSNGEIVIAAATGTITASSDHVEPAIEATTADGAGAEFTVTVEQTDATPSTWTITGVTFTGDTSGYVDGQEVTFGGDDVVEVATAAAVARTARVEPTVEVVEDSVGGTNAVLTATLTAYGTTPETWLASSITIVSPGVGYAPFNVFLIRIVDGVETTYGIVEVTDIGENGEIADVNIISGGEFYKPTDELDFIELTEGGEYYSESGAIESIEITDGGAYYAEDPSLSPYISDIAVTVIQLESGIGQGAQIEATVDDDTGSATFGQIVSLELINGGEGYSNDLYGDCSGNPLP